MAIHHLLEPIRTRVGVEPWTCRGTYASGAKMTGMGTIAARPPTFFPTNPQWDSYTKAWDAGNMSRYLVNSAIVTIIITIGQVVTAVLAGYAFAFLEFPFKRILFVTFLATLMVPFEITIVTNLATINDLGWYDSYQGLAVPFLATGFGAFLMRQAFLQVPRDLHILPAAGVA